jgi:N-acyl-D-aspartate/D-glutamate deacylase
MKFAYPKEKVKVQLITSYDQFRFTLIALCVFATLAPANSQAAEEPIDLIITNGRVIDPETGLDAIRDIAVSGGRIVAITQEYSDALDEQVLRIDAQGMVVAPGFIDLHVHGQSDQAHEYQVRDGVTTALELEWGYAEVGSFLESRRGRSRVNYGASASHAALRALALVDREADREFLRRRLAQAVQIEEPLRGMQAIIGETFYAELPSTKEALLQEELERAFGEGAIGIGMPHAYYPGASSAEIYELFEIAEDLDVPIFTHVRGRGLSSVQEVIANAAGTGASLHIVHVNSVSLGDISSVLRLIQGARARGVDVTAEAYPYTAGSTSIQSALFDGDWQSSYGISYDGLQWQATGERLNAETFVQYREQGGAVIIHMMQEEWIDQAIGNDWVIVASDGMPYAPGAHPRTAGTFSRVLGRYVREKGVIDLQTAIRKMTLLPARRLEKLVPDMMRKGRLQVGADADIVVFDAATIIDTATFESGPSFSEGVEFVFVNGVAVVMDGEAVPDVFPGEAVRSENSAP